MVGYVNVLHEMDSNLNTSPKMSHAVLACDIVMLQNHMLVFRNERVWNLKRGIICAGTCIMQVTYVLKPY